MADWKLSGTYLESCSCDPGCGCNFKGIWAEGEIATNERMKVEAPEISFDLSGRHSVFAPFEYAVA